MRILFLLYFLSFVGYLSAQKNAVELTIVDIHEQKDSVYNETFNSWELKLSPFRAELLMLYSDEKFIFRKTVEEDFSKEKDWITYRIKKGKHLFYLFSYGLHDTIFIPLNLQNDTTIYFDDLVDKEFYPKLNPKDTIFHPDSLDYIKHWRQKIDISCHYYDPMEGCRLMDAGYYHKISVYYPKGKLIDPILMDARIFTYTPFPKKTQKKYDLSSFESEIMALEKICKYFQVEKPKYPYPYEFKIKLRRNRQILEYKGYPASPTDATFIFLFFEKYGAETCKIGR